MLMARGAWGVVALPYSVSSASDGGARRTRQDRQHFPISAEPLFSSIPQEVRHESNQQAGHLQIHLISAAILKTFIGR